MDRLCGQALADLAVVPSDGGFLDLGIGVRRVRGGRTDALARSEARFEAASDDEAALDAQGALALLRSGWPGPRSGAA